MLPASLDEAADRLQASIASYTGGVLRGAEARATGISEHATHRAEQAAAGATAAHAARMLDAIDLLERRVTASFASLREEAEDLLRGLEHLRLKPEATSDLNDALAELLLD